ncbi:MAG: hypothetical protein DMG23_05860 [Acidobacteria bacterium]|nr:MAG: hypothetical protein DMG23_05860 [Acidobacteriota bacterium]
MRDSRVLMGCLSIKAFLPPLGIRVTIPYKGGQLESPRRTGGRARAKKTRLTEKAETSTFDGEMDIPAWEGRRVGKQGGIFCPLPKGSNRRLFLVAFSVFISTAEILICDR